MMQLHVKAMGYTYLGLASVENTPAEKKIYGPYFLFVWHWLYIELIRRNDVDDIGDNVTDKLYYPETTVYNPKKNEGGCRTLI